MNTETIKPEIEHDDSHALIAVEKINALEVFNGGMLPIIDEIHKKVAVLVPDVTTAKGRKEIASMANKIARSKTLLDEVGKNLVADWKAKAKVVDDNRKLMRDKLDALKESTRAPLTAWEEQERLRIEKYENGLKDLIAFQTIPHGANVQHIQDIIEDIQRIEVGDDWGDLKERAAAAHAYALKNAFTRLEERKAYEEQQAELQRLRALEAERLKAEEAKRIKEAEEKRIQEQAELKAKAELARANAEKEAAERRAKEAEERARQAEENAKRDAELAIQREKAREEQAKREAEYKAKKEAERIEADKATAEFEKKKKEEAMRMRAQRVDEAAKAITQVMNEMESATGDDIISAIIAGDIPHVTFG